MVPLQVVAVLLQGTVVLHRVQECGARDAGVQCIAQVGDGAQQAHGGRAARLARFHQYCFEAMGREAFGRDRARKAAADHGDTAQASAGRLRPSLPVAGEHLVLVAEARAPFDVEAGTGKCRAHAARDGPCRHGRARCGEACQFTHHFGRPYPGVPLGREAIEKQRIRASDELRKAFGRIAEHHREDHVAAIEMQAMESRDRGRPHLGEGERERGKLPERRQGGVCAIR